MHFSTALSLLALGAGVTASPVQQARAEAKIHTPGPYIPEPEFRILSAPSTGAVPPAPQVHQLSSVKLEAEFGNTTSTEGSTVHAQSRRGNQRRYIFGTDDRVEWTDGNFPYTATGRLVWIDSNSNIRGICSATLVGPRHVLTAAHCVPWGQSYAIRFQANYFDGERAGGSYATNLIHVGQPPAEINACNYRNDYAVYILQDRLGDRNGYFGTRAWDSSLANRQIWFHIGYPGDKGANRPYRQQGITATGPQGCSDGGQSSIVTNADVEGGQSGGPLWLAPDAGSSERKITGVLSLTSGEGSFFASNANMFNLVASTRRDFP